MSDAPPILVLTSCTATKEPLRKRGSVAAEKLYRGQQHQRLMRGVTEYRHAGEPAGRLDLRILSAGYGLVAGTERLPAYDDTFTGLKRAALRTKSSRLRVPDTIRLLLRREWRFALLLLGDEYLQAADVGADTELGGPTVALASPSAARRLSNVKGLDVLPLDNGDAQAFSCGLVALKGELAGRLLSALTERPSLIPCSAAQLRAEVARLPATRDVRSRVDDVRDAA